MKWLADENFRNPIIRGILRRFPNLDIVRVQDIDEIAGARDPALLAWATLQDRALLTHDLSTMIAALRERLKSEPRCAPIVLVPDSLPTQVAIDDILLLDECAIEADWSAGIIHLPLR